MLFLFVEPWLMHHTKCYEGNLFYKNRVFSSEPMKMFCDNQAIVFIAINTTFQERKKHIEVVCHFIQDICINNLLYVKILALTIFSYSV